MEKRIKYIPHIDEVQKLAKEIRTETNPLVVEAKLRKMLTAYDVLNYPISGSEEPFSRARLTNGKPFYLTNDLYYPPPSVATAQRLNDEGEPLLYLSIRPQTAIAEVHATKGDHVQLSGYDLREGKILRVAAVGEYFNLEKRGYTLLPEKIGMKIAKALQNKKQEPLRSFIFMDAFIAEILQDPNASDDDYLRSRIIARVIRERLPDVEGFHYPSVIREGSPNLAIMPVAADTKLKLTATAHGHVDGVYDYGLYRFSLNKRGHIFPPNAGMVLLRDVDETL